MDISAAQAEIRHAYVHGGPGTLVSGMVWLAAAITEAQSDVATGFVVLFFGGMLIFPISKTIVQVLYRRPQESKGNPGGLAVVETIFPMIGGLLAAWLLLPHRPESVMPIAAISVGAHYFGFRTAYGDITFWVLGAVMCAVGVGAIFYSIPGAGLVAFTIAAIEILFGIWFLYVDRSRTGLWTPSN